MGVDEGDTLHGPGRDPANGHGVRRHDGFPGVGQSADAVCAGMVSEPYGNMCELFGIPCGGGGVAICIMVDDAATPLVLSDAGLKNT